MGFRDPGHSTGALVGAGGGGVSDGLGGGVSDGLGGGVSDGLGGGVSVSVVGAGDGLGAGSSGSADPSADGGSVSSTAGARLGVPWISSSTGGPVVSTFGRGTMISASMMSGSCRTSVRFR